MGIAVNPRSEYVHLFRNQIWANGGLAIDDGLDGPSPSVHSDETVVKVPSITSVSFDPVSGNSTVRGVSDPPTTVEIFWSDTAGSPGSGDAQNTLGIAYTIYQTGVFELVVHRDVRGKWISATASRILYTTYSDVFTFYRTTEVSPAVLMR
jgi:hypothetical protein